MFSSFPTNIFKVCSNIYKKSIIEHGAQTKVLKLKNHWKILIWNCECWYNRLIEDIKWCDTCNLGVNKFVSVVLILQTAFLIDI